LYALRNCADQLRRIHGISITITTRERLSDLYLVTARARDRHGREDESLGAVALGSLKGDALANALMKAETKAKRRVTLSLAGLGWLDETEIDTIAGARTGADATPLVPLPPGEGEASAERISKDEARTLKQLAQHAFGYREGERRLRADLGFEPDESLTLRHLAAHVTVAQYETLLATYQAQRQAEDAHDVP
jgi:hypothetical protein